VKYILYGNTVELWLSGLIFVKGGPDKQISEWLAYEKSYKGIRNFMNFLYEFIIFINNLLRIIPNKKNTYSLSIRYLRLRFTSY